MEREEILERLVALHDERVEEEKRGVVRCYDRSIRSPALGRICPKLRSSWSGRRPLKGRW
jgi:hypothetical protein